MLQRSSSQLHLLLKPFLNGKKEDGVHDPILASV
jgi:hypothetical protein